MRVISGTARGRRLKEPSGRDVRPTTDKVKESMFNIIQFYVPGARVLDLFAGTGQLGIDALSRGAEEVVFVDGARDSIKLVRENVRAAGFEEQARIVCADAVDFLGGCGRFDIILLDPPYDTDLIDRALEKIIEFDILENDGIILCETKFQRQLRQPDPPYRIKREYKYGAIKLTVIDKTHSE
ncbi:MAG: 16S rRNA (guanine(966)-N(2))-methyltransferase RsmD [Oscillospiraceae bacterium]|nr:16S rRNA (guanine(966)-N(2))-methyltransferase RsmD [Oscillospiraceae bacterium]